MKSSRYYRIANTCCSHFHIELVIELDNIAYDTVSPNNTKFYANLTDN